MRKRHVRNRGEDVEIETMEEVDQDAVNAVINTRAAQYISAKTNAYAQMLLDGQESATSQEMSVQNDDDYLMSIFLALNSGDYRSTYEFLPEEGVVNRGRYQIPEFTVARKKEGGK